MFPKFKAAAIDFDGIIVDSIQFHIASWQKTLHESLGIDLTPQEIRLDEGVRGVELIANLARDRQITLTQEKIEEIYQTKRRLFHSIFRLTPIPGCQELVKNLFSLKFSLAVVTSTGPDEVDSALSQLGLTEFFLAKITHDDVSLGKPAPDPYLKAAEKLGIDPKYCLAIENAPVGVTSAKAAGMVCFAVATSLDPKYLSDADKVFSSLPEVSSYIISQFNSPEK